MSRYRQAPLKERFVTFMSRAPHTALELYCPERGVVDRRVLTYLERAIDDVHVQTGPYPSHGTQKFANKRYRKEGA